MTEIFKQIPVIKTIKDKIKKQNKMNISSTYDKKIHFPVKTLWTVN